MRSKWLKFKITRKNKTSVWLVKHRISGEGLGLIKWYSQWRQYCFIPNNEMAFYNELVFSQGCLRDIAGFIKEQMDKRKKHPHADSVNREILNKGKEVIKDFDDSQEIYVKPKQSRPKIKRKKNARN